MFKRKSKMTAEKLALLVDTLGKLQDQRDSAYGHGFTDEAVLYDALILQTLERTGGFKLKESIDVQA